MRHRFTKWVLAAHHVIYADGDVVGAAGKAMGRPSDLKRRAIEVMLVIADYHAQGCDPTFLDLEFDLGIASVTLAKTLRHLEGQGYIQVCRCGGQSNYYGILRPDLLRTFEDMDGQRCP